MQQFPSQNARTLRFSAHPVSAYFGASWGKEKGTCYFVVLLSIRTDRKRSMPPLLFPAHAPAQHPKRRFKGVG
jgi:hypothetical protein